MKKAIFCTLSGLTDVSLNDLGGLTPLQKAHCPTLKRLSQEGCFLGLTPPRQAKTQAGLLAALGLDSDHHRLANGPLEAASKGYFLDEEEVAFSLRFVSLGQDTIVDISDDLLTKREGECLCEFLNNQLENSPWSFISLQGTRAVLLSRHPLSQKSIWTSFFREEEVLGKNYLEVLPGGKEQLFYRDFVTQVRSLLEGHEVNLLKRELGELPVNGCILFEGGRRESFCSNDLLREPQKICMYTSRSCSKGLAKLLKIDLVDLPFEEERYQHLRYLGKHLEKIIQDKELLVMELDYLWESTYKGNLLEKIKRMEYLDKYWLSPLYHFSKEKKLHLGIFPLCHSQITEGNFVTSHLPGVCVPPLSACQSVDSFDEKMLSTVNTFIPLSQLLAHMT